MIASIFLNILVLAGLCLLGFFTARLLHRQSTWQAWLAFAFPLGTGLLTFSLFVVSWIGVPLSPFSIALIYAMLVVATGVIYSRRRELQARQSSNTYGHTDIRKLNPQAILLQTAVGLLFLTACVLAVIRAYSTWDAIAIWSVKGYGIALEGTILAGQTWGAHGLSYPLNIPLTISLFSFFGGDKLPASKLIFPMYSGSALLWIFIYWRHLGFRKSLAYLSVLAVLSLPYLFEQSTIGYANLPYACYLFMGVTLFAYAHRVERDGLVLSGFLLGTATWTRPEGLYISLILMLVLGLIGLFLKTPFRLLILWAAPQAAVAIMWWLFLRGHAPGGEISQTFNQMLAGVREGEYHLREIYIILRTYLDHLMNVRFWGWLFPISLLAILAGAIKFRESLRPDVVIQLGSAIVLGLLMTGYYWLVSYIGDLGWWLQTGVDRMFLPATMLGFSGFLTSIGLVYESPHRSPTANQAVTAPEQEPASN